MELNATTETNRQPDSEFLEKLKSEKKYSLLSYYRRKEDEDFKRKRLEYIRAYSEKNREKLRAKRLVKKEEDSSSEPKTSYVESRKRAWKRYYQKNRERILQASKEATLRRKQQIAAAAIPPSEPEAIIEPAVEPVVETSPITTEIEPIVETSNQPAQRENEDLKFVGFSLLRFFGIDSFHEKKKGEAGVRSVAQSAGGKHVLRPERHRRDAVVLPFRRHQKRAYFQGYGACQRSPTQ